MLEKQLILGGHVTVSVHTRSTRRRCHSSGKSGFKVGTMGARTRNGIRQRRPHNTILDLLHRYAELFWFPLLLCFALLLLPSSAINVPLPPGEKSLTSFSDTNLRLCGYFAGVCL